MPPVFETNFKDLHLISRGKVRDIYDLKDSLLIVATDRLSAFDVVMPAPIPDKGKVLTALSLFWFKEMSDIVENHLITSEINEMPDICQKYSDELSGRSMLVKKAKPLPVECIVRGYISGSGLKDYKKTGAVCGIKLPSGLIESDRLTEPIFTPSTKADIGEHDENISYDEAIKLLGQDCFEEVKRMSLDIYTRGAAIAGKRGIILADTKMEFGFYQNRIILIDELLTPDSTRFWPADSYEPGRAQPSFDKQFIRDWLEEQGWDKRPPAPSLPDEVIAKTRLKYLKALERITGNTLD